VANTRSFNLVILGSGSTALRAQERGSHHDNDHGSRSRELRQVLLIQ
jgi:hypothetical protein